jgi:hypothetical protein
MANDWRYTDARRIFVVSADGRHSHSIDASVIVDYLAAGGEIDAEPAPHPEKLLALALTEGCAIESASRPYLNATWAATGPAWQLMMADAQYVGAFGAFPDGAAVHRSPTRDSSVVVEFRDIADFLALVRGIADWLSVWHRYAQGLVDAPPARPRVID